jgi:hypothetical protein
VLAGKSRTRLQFDEVVSTVYPVSGMLNQFSPGCLQRRLIRIQCAYGELLHILTRDDSDLTDQDDASIIEQWQNKRSTGVPNDYL